MTSPADLNIFDFSWVQQPEAWIALLTLSVMEIVLGIDNIVFISILVDKLPREQQTRGRITGLALAMLTRIALLFSIKWMMGLTRGLFTFAGVEVTGKDLILITGGLFLMFKGTHEIHERLEEDGINTPQSDLGDAKKVSTGKQQRFGAVLIQIALLDIVFSLDSVITAVGMAQSINVMCIAVVLSVAFMMVASGSITRFINRHPTVKMLALSFLLLIGTALIADGMHFHIPKGYIYFAMAFSVGVEVLNIRAAKKRKSRKNAGH